jgi:acetyltransferase
VLKSLLNPRGVAVIGASQNATKLGYGAVRNLVVSGYKGAIHLVNPKGGELFGFPIYSEPSRVPDPVDLAVILVPAAVVPGVLRACGARGFRAAIIGSGGFREIGEEGARLEEECLRIAQEHGMRVLGPNSIGFLDTHLPIDTSFLPLPGPTPGDITFLSHSGAICEAVIDWARGQGFGLARLISLGNQMDLTEAEMLAACVDDPNTRVVAMYLEGVGDGRAFLEQARRAVTSKPVIAIKVGRSKRGGQAVASHTGALAGEDEAYSAAFAKAGVLRAHTSDELFDWARALAWCPLPAGRRVAILTNAGGPGAIAVDAVDEFGLVIADLDSETRSRLAELLPAEASLANPVDMLASAGPREYAQCLRILLEAKGVDSVMIILPPPPMTTAAEIAGALLPQAKAAEKPIVIALMGEELIAHAAKLFRQSRIPDYRFPERAASALRALVARAEQIKRAPEELAPFPEIDRASGERILENGSRGRDGFLDAESTSDLVAGYGITPPPQAFIRNDQELETAAERLGYPLVLKLAALEVVHKTDVGGVVLGIGSGVELRGSFDRLKASADAAGVAPEDFMILVQPMVEAGVDVIIGARHDPQFGPLMMVGSGGVDVESRADVSFGLAPLGRREAEEMLAATWVGRRMAGGRGRPSFDRESVVDALLRLSRLACDFDGEIAEVEVNPLRVFEDNALALDVRLSVDSGGHGSKPAGHQF